MLSKAVIFAGSSISPKECDKFKDILFLPPAKQGDIYKAWVQYKPKVMGLIDGNFENVPSPWHKEILFVMSQHVTMLGSSSMGALRAAELQAFGMIGIGEIFEAYSLGNIEDDDEVAIVHGPAPHYHNLSEPMVNIRKTFEKAYENNVINRDFYDLLCGNAKSIFYKDRTYDNILNAFKNDKKYHQSSIALGCWVKNNKIDQKNDDAKNLIIKVQEILSGDYPENEPNYFFENTNVFVRMREIINDEMGTRDFI